MKRRPGRDRGQTGLSVKFNNPVAAGLPKKNGTRPHNDLYTNVHSSVTHEKSGTETMQMVTSWSVDEHPVHTKEHTSARMNSCERSEDASYRISFM